MKKMKKTTVRRSKQGGVTSIEYGILAAGLAIAIGAIVADNGPFTRALRDIFQNVVDSVPTSQDADANQGGGQN